GLTNVTLRIVFAWIKSNQEQAFSTKMLANAIGLSCVSCRKYLLYLSEKQMLTAQFHYGTSGRPMYMYRLFSHSAQ
ncbi:two-component system response regulator DcuR, partial [Candidatus Symbiopectobacterium sp. NZEC135]|nr:two-component system response regulator DcuR [Candidatus Symbiopectobacterium sp. NZEC135]